MTAQTDAPQMRPAAEFTTCSAEPCDNDATWEGLHCPPSDVARVWVPMCNGHLAAVHAGQRVEYIVEVHGSVGPVGDL
jgi:hypothetical protein